MTLKDYITLLCTNYSKNIKSRFIGYNTIFGSKVYGTLNNIPNHQCIETPVCENLMMGLAMGMSLNGYKPVVCFERHDFLLIALDAIVNHLDKMPQMSGGQYKFPIIIRAIVGSKSPLDAGPQHTQDYTDALRNMLKHTPVISGNSRMTLDSAWKEVGNTESGAIIIVERRDEYDKEI